MLVIRRNLLVLASRHRTYNNNSPTDHQKLTRGVFGSKYWLIYPENQHSTSVWPPAYLGEVFSQRWGSDSFTTVSYMLIVPGSDPVIMNTSCLLIHGLQPLIVTLDWSESMTMTDTQVIPSHLVCFLMWCNGFMGNTCLHIDSDPNLSNNK